MILVILAGGIGSRFGGLKQLSLVDEEGNFILDYSIYDAIKTGFDKVVFIIKEENYQIFRETIGKRVEKHIKTKYVFQNNDNIPSNYIIPPERIKPFGTAHALLCAESEIDDDFLVINADDFYGREAFEDVMKSCGFINKNQSLMVGYKLYETMSESGSVKRGICHAENGILKNIEEHEISVGEGKIKAKSLEKDDHEEIILTGEEIVSMNIMAFDKEFLKYIRVGFEEFLKSNKDNLMSAEYFLPSIVNGLVKVGCLKVKVIETQSKWKGITYKEDLGNINNFIKNQKKLQKYPQKLWF